MAPNAMAQATHDRLFPGRVSTLAATDPELVDAFDNFAFDELLRDSRLDDRTRLLCQLAALIAAGAVREFRVMAGAGLTVGVAPVELREVVYQAVAYVGMARAFDFVHAANEVLVERGIALPLAGQAAATPETRMAVGKAVQERIVGEGGVDRMYAAAPADELHIQRALTGNCFGDTVARGGLDLESRELLTFSMLAALGGCEPQLKSHAGANVRLGNDRARLLDVLTQLLPFIGYPRTLNALRVLDEVAPPFGAPEASK